MNFIPVVALAAIAAVYFAIRVGLSALLSGRHFTAEEGTYIGFTLLSAVLALAGARLIYRPAVSTVFSLVISPLLNAQAKSWLDLSPTALKGAEELAGLLVIPLIFLVLFLLIRLLFMLVARVPWNVRRQRREASYEYIPRRNKAATVMGGVNGFLISIAVLIPLCGCLVTAGDVISAFSDTGAAEMSQVQTMLRQSARLDAQEMTRYGESLSKNPVLAVFGRGPGGALFRGMTTGSVRSSDGSTIRVSLTDELSVLSSVGGNGLVTAYSISRQSVTIPESAQNAILAIKDGVLSSRLLTTVGAEAVSGIASAWFEGRSFNGLKPPALNDILSPTFDLALKLLSEETPDLMGPDTQTLTGVMLDLVDSGLFVRSISYADVMEKLGHGGLMFSILDRLLENRHLAPLADELEALSSRVVAQVLDPEKIRNGTYDDLLGEISLRLNNVLGLTREEREAEIREAVRVAFDRYGYDVPGDVAVSLSEQILAEIGADGAVTVDELKDFLLSHGASISVGGGRN